MQVNYSVLVDQPREKSSLGFDQIYAKLISEESVKYLSHFNTTQGEETHVQIEVELCISEL